MGNIQMSLGYADNIDSSTSSNSLYVDVKELTSSDNLSSISDVVNITIDDGQQIRIGVSADSKEVEFKNRSVDKTSIVESQDNGISISEITELAKVIEEEKEAEKALALQRAKEAASNYTETNTQGGLVDISNPDENYTGRAIEVTGSDRDILERLVQGEAGNQGFIGAALVAQCIRDMYVTGGFTSVDSVRRNCGYSGSLKVEPSQTVKDAVSYIFDQGGYAVKHRILYFYAPKYSAGSFHNTQNNIINYKDHRFFDRWK